MIEELISIANELDKRGLYKEADKLDTVLDVAGEYKDIVWKNLKDMFGQSEETTGDRLLGFLESLNDEDKDVLSQYLSNWVKANDNHIGKFKSWIDSEGNTRVHRDKLLERIKHSEEAADAYMEYLLGIGSFKDRLSLPNDVSMESIPTNPEQ
jgi:hypothetical protein